MGDLNEPKKETVRISLPPAPSTPENGDAREKTARISLPPQPAVSGEAPSSGAPLPPRRAVPPNPAAPSGPVVRPPMARAPMPTPSGSAPVRPPSYQPPTPSTPGAMPPRSPSPASSASVPAGEKPASSPRPPPPPIMPPRPRVLPPPPRVIPPAKASGAVSAAPSNYPGSGGGEAGPKKETARISILPEPAAVPGPAVKMAKTQPLMAAPPPKVHSAPVSTIKPAPPGTAIPSAPAPSLLDSLEYVPVPVAAVICGISAVALLIQIWNYFGS